jgi:hypothetical protein
MQVLIVTLLSFIMGLLIVKIVDYRLSNISINMPTIKIPDIIVNLPDGTSITKVPETVPKTDMIGGGYYKHPRDMTQQQLKKFREKANIKNMTHEDYKNWLSVVKS